MMKECWIAACKEGLLHAAIQHPFANFKRVADGILKLFSQVVDTLLKQLACGQFDYPLAFASLLGDF
jgi:hypothetical protein